jgi:hypothetical protein
MKITRRLLLAAMAVAATACGEVIVLKSGDTVTGEIARTVGSNVTVRTQYGISTYHVRELDQQWVDEHYDRLFPEIRQKRADEFQGFVDFLKGLLGKESLAKGTPFLKEYRRYILPASAASSRASCSASSWRAPWPASFTGRCPRT